PIVLTVTDRLRVPPMPYVIALATSANIGSSMSVTGNPQNALIGVAAKFSFLGFLAHLAPIALVGLVLNIAVLSTRPTSAIGARWARKPRNENLAATPISAFCGFPVTDILEPIFAEVASAIT